MSNTNDFTIENGTAKAYHGSDSCMVIPDGVTTLGGNLLRNKPHVTSAVIPPSVTRIEDFAFYNGLSYDKEPDVFTVHIRDLDAWCGIGVYEDATLFSARSVRLMVNQEILQELTIPSGITCVPTLFKNCMDLKKVTIPEGVTEIAKEAFHCCRNLTHVTLPASLKSIGAEAFAGCPLTHLEIPENATFKIGRIFGYTSFPGGLLAQMDALAARMDVEGIRSYIIPDGWGHLSEDTKARIFLSYQDVKMKKAYKKLLKPADLDPLSEAMLHRLGAKISKKECDTLVQFMLDYGAHLSGYSMKTMYDAIAKQKNGAAALKPLDANAGLKKKIASAPAKPMQKDKKAARTKHDVAFDNMEFDDNGRKVYALGNKEVHAVVQPDLSVLIVDPTTGKSAKSVPKRGADPELYAAAAGDFKAVQKGVRTLTVNCRNILYDLYLSAGELPVNKWKAEWTGNPVTRGLASMVVWQQGSAFFSLDESRPVTENGTEYAIAESPVRVAHTMDMRAEEITAWQKFFTARQRKQPFLQIWEPSRPKEDIRADRYAGCIIRSGYLRNQQTLGIKAEWYNQEWFDGDIFQHRYLQLEGFETEATGNEDGDELEITKIVPKCWNRRTNAIISYLDRITIYGRIHADDTSVAEVLDQFTLEQIMDFLRVATEHACANAAAVLLEYKARHFGDFDPMDEFVLEL